MFGPLGLPEILFILAIALLIFGPKRLPEIGRTVGKAMGEFRRASEELKRTVHSEIAALDAETRKLAAEAAPELAGKAPARSLARGALTSALGLDGVGKELEAELKAIPEAANQVIAETGLPVPGRIAALARSSSSPPEGVTPGLEFAHEPSIIGEASEQAPGSVEPQPATSAAT